VAAAVATGSIRSADVRFTELRYLRMAWIGRSWNPTTVSALAAIFGSFVGAFASTQSAWLTQRHHDRKDLLAKKIAHREQLYPDFIRERIAKTIHSTQRRKSSRE